MVTLSAFLQASPANATEPDQDAMPSYILDAPLSIASLFDEQDDAAATDTPAAAKNGRSDSDAGSTDAGSTDAGSTDASIRDALEELSKTDGAALRDDGELDQLDQVANRSLFGNRRTTFADGRFVLPPIEALTTSTKEIGDGVVPLGFRNGENPPVIELPESGIDRSLAWQWTPRYWAASNLFSHPLYFEDRMLERHGHQRFPLLQPAVSGGRFVAQAFMLPYLGAINPPCECQYTLGYYRAGDCVPVLKQRPPYQRKAAVAQAGAIGAWLAILP